MKNKWVIFWENDFKVIFNIPKCLLVSEKHEKNFLKKNKTKKSKKLKFPEINHHLKFSGQFQSSKNEF